MVFRRCIIFFLCCIGALNSYANNIRLGNVEYRTSELSGSNLTTLTLSLTVSWDNSWCDPYNWDAAYIFLKYRLKTDATATWHTLYIEQPNTTAVGYACSLAPGAPGNRGMGIFVERTADDHGPASVPVTLKWNITSNSRAVPTFSNIKGYEVQVQAFGIEMVRVPRGPFRVGDNHSKNGFWRDYTPFPASEDLINSSSVLDETSSGDPYQAADHVGGSVGDTTSCWIPGSYDTEPYWAVDFGTPGKCIRYIGICAARNSGVPGRWQLRGKNRMSDKGTVLFEKTSADWIFAQNAAYPLEQTIPVANDKTYRYYLLEFFDISGTLAVKSIAMTDADMPLVRDHTVLVDAAELVLDNKCHFAAQDGTPWTSGSVGSDYPNGYPEFYAMKYELSQEQYVSFLNTLSLAQQQALLPGLSKLSEGDYVFGGPANPANQANPNNPNSRKIPANRNGIIVERKRPGEPVFFANNLNPDNLPNRGDDGGTLACNYLSLQDLLAYAAWSGLRPLTELEYEKLCRPLYVYENVPVAGEYAWNTATLTQAGALTQAGTAAESASGNVNHGTVAGPLRCGIFAGNRPTTREGSGAGYWGCFELSGNLAEPFYNVNAAGRLFRGKDFAAGHGTGYLTAAALPEAGIASSWPVGMDAFALRGGSFSSATADELSVSDRRYFRNYFSSLTVRDSSVGIRLGRTCPVDAGAVVQNTLTLQNGHVGSGDVIACDTLGDGEDYVITGSGASEVGPVYSVLWYKSEDLGTEWALMEGNTDKDLYLTKMTGRFAQGTKMREYRYRRRIITPTGESTSAATLYVADPSYSINRYRETLVYGTTSHGITVTGKNAGLKVKWVDIKTGTELPVTAETATSSYYRADCHDFPDFVPGEERKIEVSISIFDRLHIKDTVTYIIPVVKYSVEPKKEIYVAGSSSHGIRVKSDYLSDLIWIDCLTGDTIVKVANTVDYRYQAKCTDFPDFIPDREREIKLVMIPKGGCYIDSMNVTYSFPAPVYVLNKRAEVIPQEGDFEGILVTTDQNSNIKWTDVKTGQLVFSSLNTKSSRYKASCADFPDPQELEVRQIDVEIATVDGCYTAKERVQYTLRCTDILVDPRDRQVYPVVKIGSQWWMAANINIGDRVSKTDYSTHGRTGIQKICYRDIVANCDKYGGLYRWEEAVYGENANAIKYVAGSTSVIQGICPDGWHIPSDAEWRTLEMSLGMSATEANKYWHSDGSFGGWRGTNEGDRLKSKEWSSSAVANSSRFNALPSGGRPYAYVSGHTDDTYANTANWWTSTEASNGNHFARKIMSTGSQIYRYGHHSLGRSCGFSVRCVKN